MEAVAKELHCGRATLIKKLKIIVLITKLCGILSEQNPAENPSIGSDTEHRSNTKDEKVCIL